MPHKLDSGQFGSFRVLNLSLVFSELKTRESWSELNYAKNFDVSWEGVNDVIERIHVNDVSPKDFIQKFEAPYKPVVILGVQDSWNALQKWTLEVIMRRHEKSPIEESSIRLRVVLTTVHRLMA